MNEYKGKTVLVLGLGVSGGGVGAARFLARAGADITVFDKKTKKELKDSIAKLVKHKNIHYILGKSIKTIKHRRFNSFDMVVVNPAIDLRSSVVKRIKKAGIPIESEMGLFLRHCKGRVIAITGTKGKGTVATLTYNILWQAKKGAVLGGNIGVSLLSQLPYIKKSTYAVLEISSFQLDLLRLSCPEPSRRATFYISALTNIYPDHLDRYESFAQYKKSKLSLFGYPAKYKIKRVPRLPSWIEKKKVKLLGGHNEKNIALAIEIAKRLRLKKEDITKAVYRFRGLSHRLEYVGTKKGIAFYDDAYSTTPDSTIVALRSFQFSQSGPERDRGAAQHIILIAGGVSKGASFRSLAREAKRRARRIILFGKSARDIQQSFKIAKTVKSSTLDMRIVRTLKDAVREAKKNAAQGDIVLFSPACASFDQFRNAKERGEAFRRLVKKL